MRDDTIHMISDEGLRVLEQRGLKKIIDDNFSAIRHPLLSGHLFDDDLKIYAKENNRLDLVRKMRKDDPLDRTSYFVMHSGIVCNLLQTKLPQNLNADLKEAISAYYLYFTKFNRDVSALARGAYLFRNNDCATFISGDANGDMQIRQYTMEPDSSTKKQLVKEVKFNMVDGNPYFWIPTLIHLITFCCQIKKPVPFKDNWKKEFYNGVFEETKPGSVSDNVIDRLKRAKEGERSLEVLPFLDNPKKHIDPNKDIYHISPISSDTEFGQMPFIEGENLVYLDKSDEGVEFAFMKWKRQGVRIAYDQMPHAIRGVVNCIIKGSSRNASCDPGLVFEFFPYKRFENFK